MNIKCKLFGHSHVTGTIKNFDDLTRCTRCGKQLIFEDKLTLARTLKGRADAKRKIAEHFEDTLFKGTSERCRNTAEVYEEAANLLEERQKEIKEKEGK